MLDAQIAFDTYERTAINLLHMNTDIANSCSPRVLWVHTTALVRACSIVNPRYAKRGLCNDLVKYQVRTQTITTNNPNYRSLKYIHRPYVHKSIC